MDLSIYPVCVTAHAQHIWFGWRSVDDPSDVIVKINGLLLWDRTKTGYMKKHSQFEKKATYETETIIDLDSIARRLESNECVDANDILNAWNMLTDIRNSLDFQKGAAFPLSDERYIETYDRIFSNTPTAGLIDFDAGKLTKEDYGNAAKVISSGIAMVLNVTTLYQSDSASG